MSTLLCYFCRLFGRFFGYSLGRAQKFYMDLFLKETKTLQRVLYKSKNAHRCTLYYRKTVHVYRLIRKYLETERAQKKREILLKDLQDRCMEAYVALSSNVARGHNLGLTICLMAVIAKLYSLSKMFKEKENTSRISYVVEEEDSSTEKDDISDIFNK
ncbi:hypothetical protein NEMIN01_0878 [Nematocida minor]|uniref:uncharacterized protein n=1 Tax=Nematocida minor TaxID=1912983 RepID=UPI0022208D09|nr:uncharacterized protein NEMIN01_0878 [Nematocida minor]KAI5190093.1 hypothetical protein NEMIN01_0878 [Nematocida minor]